MCGIISWQIWWGMPVMNYNQCEKNIFTGNIQCDNTIYVRRTPFYFISYIFSNYFNKNVVITKLI